MGAQLPGRALLTVWKLSSGRAALPVGGDILRQESGSGLSLPGEVTTLGIRLDREGLPENHVCLLCQVLVLAGELHIGVKYGSLWPSAVQNTSGISHCLAGFGLKQRCP